MCARRMLHTDIVGASEPNRWRWLRWICLIETPARRCLNAWRFWSAVMWAKPIGRREGRARLPRLAARVYNPSCQIGKKKATPALFF